MKLFYEIPQRQISPREESELTGIIRCRSSAKKCKDTARQSLAMLTLWEAVVYMRSCCRDSLSVREIFSLAWDGVSRAARNFIPHRKGERFFIYVKPYLRGNINREWRLRSVVRNSSGQEPYVTEADDHEMENAVVRNLGWTEPETDAVETRDLWGQISPLLHRLSGMEKKVLRLHYFDGLDFTSAGRRLRVTRSATQATHNKALRKIRKWVRLEEIRRGNVRF